MTPSIFTFYECPLEISGSNVVVFLDLTGMTDENWEKYLFEQYFKQLKFPGYFGFNWNAFYDCMRDLEWIQQKSIKLVHSEIDFVPINFKIYLGILSESAEAQLQYGYKISVLFSEKNRDLVTSHVSANRTQRGV